MVHINWAGCRKPKKTDRDRLMGIFEGREVEPMLISQQLQVFDHPDWIYKLKLDGFRCLAYAENGSFLQTDLRLRWRPCVILLCMWCLIVCMQLSMCWQKK